MERGDDTSITDPWAACQIKCCETVVRWEQGGFLIAPIQYFFFAPVPPGAILGLVTRTLPARNTRMLIALDVFLRLTKMDVCCGPPR